MFLFWPPAASSALCSMSRHHDKCDLSAIRLILCHIEKFNINIALWLDFQYFFLINNGLIITSPFAINLAQKETLVDISVTVQSQKYKAM